MSHHIQCISDSDEHRFPEAGHESHLHEYCNNTHRAAIEDCPAIDISGLTIMWGNWAALRPSELPNLLHGAKMVLGLSYLSAEYAEIEFLGDVAARMAAEEVNYK
jgi:hypothetical protein